MYRYLEQRFLTRLDWRILTGIIFGLLVCLGLAMRLVSSQTRPYHLYSFNAGSSTAPAAQSNKVAPNLEHVLTSPPSISPARIEEVLKQYRSPATGAGQTLYDLGLRYGIDPAYALAFFVHESSAGTQGVAAITKSIGNIRCTPGYDCYQTSGNGSFRRYPSWEAGIEDWYKLIKELYIEKWGLSRLSQIIPVYAPSADRNNPANYVQEVAHMVESWRSVKPV